MNAYAAFAIIFVIILTWYLYARLAASWYEDFLTGVWLADGDEFCDACGVQSIMVYIGEPAGTFTTARECYIVITDNIAATGFTLEYSRGWGASGGASGGSSGGQKYTIHCTSEFDDEPLWRDVTLELDALAGRLKIRDDNTLYAVLYKRHDIESAAAQ